MAKKENGSGSISYEKSRGKYRAQFTTPSGRRVSKRFATRKEAAAWLSAQSVSVAVGTYAEPSRITLGEWLVTWLRDYKRPAVSIRTMDRYTGLTAHCADIAFIQLQQLSAPVVQSLYNSLLEKISPATVKKVHTLLHAAIHRALITGLVSRNVIDAVEPPRQAQRKEIETFRYDEIISLYKAAQEYVGGRYFPLVYLAISTGARLGELLALRLQDIDGNEVHITRNLQSTARNGIVINPPKTRAGRRTIAVPPDVIEALSIDPEMDPSLLIFRTRNNTPLCPHNTERAWRAIVQKAGIPYRNFHVLRHTHATDLLARGVPIVEVARRLGHARVSHTLELYGHAIPRYDQKIADHVAQLYHQGG